MKTVLICLVAAFLFGLPLVHAQKNPKPIEMPSPGYPEELTNTGLNGAAEVDLVVKADGTVGAPVLAMATHRAFGRAAMAAVRLWKFEPAMDGGVPIDRKVSIPFVFTAPFDQTINAIAKRTVFLTLDATPLTEKEFPPKKLKIKRPARPMYPRSLMGSNIEEKVQVKFVVAPDGSTLNPAIVKPPKNKEFAAPAIQAVALMSYEPPLIEGKPVYVETTTTLNFANEQAAFGEFGGRGGRGGGGGGGGGGRGGGGGDFGGGGGGPPDEE